MADINNQSQYPEEQKKTVPIGMIALSIILSVVLIFLVIMYFDQKNKMIEMEEVLTQEKIPWQMN